MATVTKDEMLEAKRTLSRRLLSPTLSGRAISPTLGVGSFLNLLMGSPLSQFLQNIIPISLASHPISLASSQVTVMAASAKARTNIHAVGIGKKLVKGDTTEDRCIRIYVTKKLPRSLLSADTILPREIDGIPTDIIESEPAFMNTTRGLSTDSNPSCSYNRKQKQNPLIAGISISHPQVTTGTIAYFCRSTDPADSNNSKQVYLLSNNHILANVDYSKIGDDIYQPGVLDNGTSVDTVAKLHRGEKLKLGSKCVNEVDAAIAALNPDTRYKVSICSIGSISGTESAMEDMLVMKHGRTTGYSEGIVTDDSYDVLVGFNPNNLNVVAKFEGQLRIDNTSAYPCFAKDGDSGSLLVSKDDKKAVGLYFAGPDSGIYGIANHISVVLQKLKIQLL